MHIALTKTDICQCLSAVFYLWYFVGILCIGYYYRNLNNIWYSWHKSTYTMWNWICIQDIDQCPYLLSSIEALLLSIGSANLSNSLGYKVCITHFDSFGSLSEYLIGISRSNSNSLLGRTGKIGQLLNIEAAYIAQTNMYILVNRLNMFHLLVLLSIHNQHISKPWKCILHLG